MKLRPIHRSDISKAADLLAEGFPKLSCETWTACLANIVAHVENLGHDSIGQFASANDGEVGICLTIPSRRIAYAEAPREIMNLSDRILVSRLGRIVEEFTPGEATEERIMYAAVH